MWRKGNHCELLVGMQIGSGFMENSIEVPQKIKNKIAIWSINSTPGYIFREDENTNSKRHMNHSVYCNIIYNSQDMETT